MVQKVSKFQLKFVHSLHLSSDAFFFFFFRIPQYSQNMQISELTKISKGNAEIILYLFCFIFVEKHILVKTEEI